jgi:anti-sigma-K factor RskA
MSEQEHVAEQLGAYALGSLEETQAAQIEAHLTNCSQCQAELEGYQALVGHLAWAATAAEPPADLRERLMVRARRARARPAPDRERWWITLMRLVSRPAPAWSLGLVSLALVVVLGFMWLGPASGPEALTTIALAGTGAAPRATGVIVLSADGEYGSLVVDGLPDLDPDSQYQLWLIQDGERTSGGVFSVHEGYGQMEIVAPQPLSSYEGFGITVEPAGGSPGPTGDKVLGSS